VGQPKNSPKRMRLKSGEAGAAVDRVLDLIEGISSAQKSGARKVVATLDGEPVLGPGPEPKWDTRRGETKYHVGNLSHEATEADLRELFAPLGQIVECHLFKDSFDGKSRGFACVRIIGDDARALAGTMLGGRALRIEPWGR